VDRYKSHYKFQVRERHGPKAFGEGWLQVSISEMKVKCWDDFGGCNRGKFNLEMEWLGCGLCYHWVESV